MQDLPLVDQLDVKPVERMMETINALVKGFFAHLPQLVVAFVVIILTFFLAKFIAFLIRKVLLGTRTRRALIRLTTNLTSILVWVIGVSIATVIIFPSITPAKLVAGLGLTSVAIGFAFKDVIENFLAGIIILGRKKMRIGDVIECDDIFGKVEDIAVRETHVRDVDGELTIVPNAYLFKNPLKIQTDEDFKRTSLTVGVDYDTSMEDARDVLTKALRNCQTINSDKPIWVECVAFGGSSIDFRLMWWTGSAPKDLRASYDEVAFAVKKALDDANITIPFPQITVSHRPEHYPVEVKQRAATSEGEQST